MRVRGADELIQAFDRYHDNAIAAGDRVADEFTRSYREEVRESAYRTGAFYSAIDWRESIGESEDYRTYAIDAAKDVTVYYEGWVDQGTRHIEARRFGADAIENANIEPIFDSVANRSF